MSDARRPPMPPPDVFAGRVDRGRRLDALAGLSGVDLYVFAHILAEYVTDEVWDFALDRLDRARTRALADTEQEPGR